MRFVLGRLDEFEPGTRRVVNVGGREIGVFRVDDAFYAVRNRCPHQGGPLARGRVFRRMVSERPGVVTLLEAPLISCPWHGWHWDLRTGEAYAPDDPRVRSYSVVVMPGQEVSCALEQGAVAEALQAETYSVSVEESYVVLDA